MVDYTVRWCKSIKGHHMDRVEHDTNEYYRGIDKAERHLDNFKSDIEPLVEEISDLYERIKEIEKGYEDNDFSDEITEMIGEIIPPVIVRKS